MNQPQKSPPVSIDMFINNAFKMTTGLNNFISSVQENLGILNTMLAKLQEENKEIPKLKAEIFELKGTITILKKKKK